MANNKYKARKSKQQSPSVCKHAKPGPTTMYWYPPPGQPRTTIAITLQNQGTDLPPIDALPQVITLAPIDDDGDYKGDIDLAASGYGGAALTTDPTTNELSLTIDLQFMGGGEEIWSGQIFVPPLTTMQDAQQFLLRPTLQPGLHDFLVAAAARSF